MCRLREDIPSPSVRHFLASSPSEPFLCRRNPVLQSMLSRAVPGNLLAMQILWPHRRHPESEKLERGPGHLGFHKPSSRSWHIGPSLSTTAVGHPSRDQAVFKKQPDSWKAYIFIGDTPSSPFEAFPSSPTGRSWPIRNHDLWPGERLLFFEVHPGRQSPSCLDHTQCLVVTNRFQIWAARTWAMHILQNIRIMYPRSYVSPADTWRPTREWGSLKSLFASLFYHLKHVFQQEYWRHKRFYT